MHIAYLLLGGNLGNRLENIGAASTQIEKRCGMILRSSFVYETAAWGKQDQPTFLNQAIEIETDVDAQELMKRLLAIEAQMGRQRVQKYGPRTIDLDILFYDKEIINNENLKIPHPEIPNRRFVLVPMAEIAPDLVHPGLGKSIVRLLRDCPDQLEVKQWPD